MIFCAGNIESFDFARTLGIGLVQSSITLTKIILEEKPEEIIFIGSFGLYKEGKIGDIVEVKQACNIELSSLLNLSYSPLKNSYKEGEILINSSNFITKNEALASALFEQGILGENMEVFSFFEVAKEFQLPAKAYLVATNFCSNSAHEDFLKNHKICMEKLTQYLKDEKII